MLCTFSPFKNSNPASIPNIPPLPGLLSQEAPLLLRGVCVCVCARWVRCVCCHSTPLSSVVTPCFRSDEVPAKSPPARDSVSISVSSGILRGVCVGGTIHTEFKSNHKTDKSQSMCVLIMSRKYQTMSVIKYSFSLTQTIPLWYTMMSSNFGRLWESLDTFRLTASRKPLPLLPLCPVELASSFPANQQPPGSPCSPAPQLWHQKVLAGLRGEFLSSLDSALQ